MTTFNKKEYMDNYNKAYYQKNKEKTKQLCKQRYCALKEGDINDIYKFLDATNVDELKALISTYMTAENNLIQITHMLNLFKKFSHIKLQGE